MSRPSLRILSVLYILGRVRDALLVLASLVYVSGYLTWNAYTWIARLGRAPAIDAQYFGIGIAAILMMSIIMAGPIILDRVVFPRWDLWLKEQSRNRQLRLLLSLLLTAFTIISVDALIAPMYGYGPFSVPSSLMLFLAYSLMMFCRPPRKSVRDYRIQNRRLRLVMYTYLPVTAILIGFPLLFKAYAHLPQSLGGGAPRRALLELRATSVSHQLLKQLAPNAATVSEAVVRTNELSVLSTVGNTITIATQGRDHPRLQVELPRDAIAAVIWRN
jgi:hypothetical protein